MLMLAFPKSRVGYVCHLGSPSGRANTLNLPHPSSLKGREDTQSSSVNSRSGSARCREWRRGGPDQLSPQPIRGLHLFPEQLLLKPDLIRYLLGYAR